MGPSRVSFAMLYDYLRSLFHVWKLIPFEASLRGSAALHYLTSTLSILAPSRGVMFYCYVGLWMRLLNAAGRYGALQRKEQQKMLDTGLNCCLMMSGGPFSLVFFFFEVLSSCSTTRTTHCRIGTAPDSKSCARSFETASGVSQFTLWDGGEGWVFPLPRSSASNTTPIS